MKLLDDVARCDGVETDGEVNENCFSCARLTAPRPKYFWISPPPKFIDGVCPDRIEEQ